VAKFCDESSDRIPVGFILGFYVSLVVGRFWEQLNALPWMSRMAVYVTSMIHRRDEDGRKLRRTIMRYFSVAYILTMRQVCPPVRKRFENFEAITEAGKEDKDGSPHYLLVNYISKRFGIKVKVVFALEPS